MRSVAVRRPTWLLRATAIGSRLSPRRARTPPWRRDALARTGRLARAGPPNAVLQPSKEITPAPWIQHWDSFSRNAELGGFGMVYEPRIQPKVPTTGRTNSPLFVLGPARALFFLPVSFRSASLRLGLMSFRGLEAVRRSNWNSADIFWLILRPPKTPGRSDGELSCDRRPLVQERRDLLPIRQHLYGCKRRRHRRLQGPIATAGLPARARHHRDLADAVPAFARQGRWLRHLRLLRRRSALRHARRFCRVHPWLPAARHPCHHRPRRQPHLRPAPLVSRGAQLEGFAPSRLVCLVR